MFYVAGNVGVITDLDTNEQVLLQGHVRLSRLLNHTCALSNLATWFDPHTRSAI